MVPFGRDSDVVVVGVGFVPSLIHGLSPVAGGTPPGPHPRVLEIGVRLHLLGKEG